MTKSKCTTPRIYECVLYNRPTYGDPVPVQTDGQIWSREIVAASAGKARYSYWLDLRDNYEEIRFQDIRVRSLSSKKADPMQDGWPARMKTANDIIAVMAKYGRRFFSENSDRCELVENPFIAHFKVDGVGELWFVDRYTRKPVLVRHSEWPRFSDGGTLRGIVERLSEHIKTGAPINIGYFSPSPEWVCRGDLWGYGDDMPLVRDEVQRILATIAEAA